MRVRRGKGGAPAYLSDCAAVLAAIRSRKEREGAESGIDVRRENDTLHKGEKTERDR